MAVNLTKSVRDLGARWPELQERAKRAAQSRLASKGLHVDRRPPKPLQPDDVESFFAEGYLIKEKLVSPDDVNMINRAVDRAWEDRSIYNPLTISAWTSTTQYIETYVRYVDRSARTEPYKLNHLYLYDHSILSWIMSSPIRSIVEQLIGGTPILFNGLNMELGTEQRFHSDTLYMAPRTRDKMAVAWIALEDIKPGAGALRYYAKSHLIEPFVFSNGGIAAKHEEMPEFDKYMAEQLRSENLEFTEFYPKAGDVFFWHSQLYHGGSPIEDSAATRRSMVLHFWRAEDVPSEMCLRVGRDDFILDPRYMPVATAFTPTGRKEGSVGEST